jgi:hypothetical protein
MKRVLLIGIHPDAVDTSDPSFPAAHLLLGGCTALLVTVRLDSLNESVTDDGSAVDSSLPSVESDQDSRADRRTPG